MTTANKGARSTRASGRSNGHKKVVAIRKVKFEVPLTAKARLAQYMRKGRDVGLDETISMIEELLGPEQMEKFWEIDIDLEGQGINAFGEFINEAAVTIFDSYGVELGE